MQVTTRKRTITKIHAHGLEGFFNDGNASHLMRGDVILATFNDHRLTLMENVAFAAEMARRWNCAGQSVAIRPKQRAGWAR